MNNELLINNFRNIGISAHIDAGKTTTTERILFYTGINYKMGEVHEGKATMDWMPQEQERGITITSASTTVFWFIKNSKYKINIIDTPGHVDFTVEVERCMRVIEGACMLYCAVSGVQSQSESVWRQSVKYGISKIIFVNKMDREGADFYKLYDNLKLILKANPVPIFIPYFFNKKFIGVIDLIKFKLMIWNENDKGGTFYFKDIPFNYFLISKKWRNNVIEVSINNDDCLIDKFFNEKLNNLDIYSILRLKTIENYIQPMICGSSFKNKGVQCLLDSIVRFLPSPLDFLNSSNPNVKIVDYLNSFNNKNFLALAFKSINDSFIGVLIFFRIYAGSLKPGDTILNSSNGKKEKITRILRIHANKKEDINFVSAGDIAAIAGLKNVKTGDTLCDPKHRVILDGIFFPQPVISQSLSIKNKFDEEKLLDVLEKLSFEDPSFKFHIDNDSKEIIINGMGELHLEIMIDKIRNDYNIDISFSKPKVSYKETISVCSYNIEGKYIRQSGGRGQYGHVIINLKPNKRGSGFLFLNKIRSGSIPKEYISSIEKSFKDCLNSGVLYNYPVIDIIIELIDGSYHEVDSSENAFKIASSIAFKEGLKKSDPILLEPIMDINIEVPEEYMGAVLGDLSSRKGNLLNISDLFNNYKLIKCNIPLSEIFNYSTTLRSLTKGRGLHSSSFSHYLEVKNFKDF